MTRKVKEIDFALTRKGFHDEKAQHHVMYWLYVNGRKTSVRTRISHGEVEIGTGLLGRMARELRVSKAEFLQLVSCKITGEVYRNKMVSEGQVHDA